VADVTGCIDGVSTSWYIGILDVIGCIDGNVHPGVGVTDVNGCRECVGSS